MNLLKILKCSINQLKQRNFCYFRSNWSKLNEILIKLNAFSCIKGECDVLRYIIYQSSGILNRRNFIRRGNY